MRLTRRGWGVVALVVLGESLAFTFGARSLNAVVAPALVALAFGVVQVARRSPPTVSRSRPAPGFPGERRRVEVTVDTDVPCDVTEATGDGLRAVEATARLVSGGRLSYDLELGARGEHDLGPARVTLLDSLGLVAREVRTGTTTPVLVYPDVRPLATTEPFAGLVERAGTPDRQAFDALREYVPGDALRDVHWASSAKQPGDDLVVTEFAARDEGGIAVVAEADAGHADAMASAAASVATHLLDADLLVSVACPDGRIDEGRGEDHADAMLELLARSPAGRVGVVDREAADVRVVADDEGTTVEVDGRRFAFADLAEGTPTPQTPAATATGAPNEADRTAADGGTST